MANSSKLKAEPGPLGGSGFALIGEDLLDAICRRLPAVAFASASCVSKSWHRVCKRILSGPKLASALSLKRPDENALQEVVDKVLSEPICPHFVIVNVGRSINQTDALQYIAKRLGARTPTIICADKGVIGRDALTNEVKEVEGDLDAGVYDDEFDGEHAIALTVGFVPGLKVDLIPLLNVQDEGFLMMDKFIMDIRKFAVAASGCSTPVGLVMFGSNINGIVDIKSATERLDYAMPTETAIAGVEKSFIEYGGFDKSRYIPAIETPDYSVAAITLVFAKDNTSGLGDIRFHVTLSDGLLAVGPRHRAVSVQFDGSYSSLTARKEGQHEILDGEGILNDIREEMEDHEEYPDVYIGVTRVRKHAVGAEKENLMTCMSFHAVLGGDKYLQVEDGGIQTGDDFQFYYADVATARASCRKVSANLRNLNLGYQMGSFQNASSTTANVYKTEVFGGLIFSSVGRGGSFFEVSNVDSLPFVENFPEVPMAGMFCSGEIGRRTRSLNVEDEGGEESSIRCCCHVYSTVYLAMSYSPPQVATVTT